MNKLIKAFGCFKQAADLGYATAQVWVGKCYQHETGTSKDDQQAIAYYQLAANQGDAEAESALADLKASTKE